MSSSPVHTLPAVFEALPTAVPEPKARAVAREASTGAAGPSLDRKKGRAHAWAEHPTTPMESRTQADLGGSSDAPAGEAPRAWFSQEVLPHEGALRSWLRARFPSLADTDDIVQESYARLLQPGRREHIGNAKSYLFSTAHNLVLDLFRHRRRVPTVPAASDDCPAVPEERINVVDAVCTAQEFELLQQAIDSLPERCREIMVLQKLQGLSNAAIAARLNLSVNTVNAQLVIGLARCRAYLLARGVLRGRKA